jgi:hypothetical protein
MMATGQAYVGEHESGLTASVFDAIMELSELDADVGILALARKWAPTSEDARFFLAFYARAVGCDRVARAIDDTWGVRPGLLLIEGGSGA